MEGLGGGRRKSSGGFPWESSSKVGIEGGIYKETPQKPLTVIGMAPQLASVTASWGRSWMAGRLKEGAPPLREVVLWALTCSSLRHVQTRCGFTAWLHTTCARSDGGLLLGPPCSLYIEYG